MYDGDGMNNLPSEISSLYMGIAGAMANEAIQRELRKKACPVCRDSGFDKRTKKPCFYCKKETK